MSLPILEFDKVGKLYCLGTFGTGSVTRDITRWWKKNILHQIDPYLRIGEKNNRTQKGNSNIVWALKDISFEVNQGDVVGIIGKNGAGKSTLLKLLSRITAPTTGTIKAQGRVASLLEIGTGFHPELTGRENIYMNGTVMGMTKHEIERKLDEIVDFAGVERYLDTPVKRYSSGMTVRLGFAVAAFLEPEILVVDEVLAVGDIEFQKKAIGKMQNISKEFGRTVLFVSHNMTSIKTLCSKGLLLDKGEIIFEGNAIDTVKKYLSREIKGDQRIIDKIEYIKDWIKIEKIIFNGSEYNKSVIKSGQQYLSFSIEGYAKEDFKTDPMIIIRNRLGHPMATFAQGYIKGEIVNIKKGYFKIDRTLKLPKFLGLGDYTVDIILHYPIIEYQMKITDAVEVHIEGCFENGGRSLTLKDEGIIGLESI